MNWIKKILIASISFWLCSGLFAEDNLKLSWDLNRFYDKDGNTICTINYKIPYNSLLFKQDGKEIHAKLNLAYKLLKGNTVVLADNYTKEISSPDWEKVSSGRLYFVDNLAFTLSKPGFMLEVTATDPYSQKNNVFTSELGILQGFLSDVDFVQKAQGDDGRSYVSNNPSHIFELPWHQDFYVQYQVKGMKGGYWEKYKIIKSGIALQDSVFSVPDTLVFRERQIGISSFDEGYYTLELSVTDASGEIKETKNDFFVIKKQRTTSERFFVDLDDERKLMQYFEKGRGRINWNNLSDKAKQNYIERFWGMMDPTPQTPENEFRQIVQERMNIANVNYTSGSLNGWKTDIGRVYIRNGAPDDIIKKQTSADALYARAEYEIWKYRSGMDKTYIFVDFQGNKNYRIIYSENDEIELTKTNWQEIVGLDFDESLLR